MPPSQPDLREPYQALLEGRLSRREFVQIALGLGMTAPSELAGAVESNYFMTEENARNYYRRWLGFVRGDPWSTLMAGG